MEREKQRREEKEGQRRGREGRKKLGRERGRKEWREKMKNKNISCGTNMNEWSILSRLFKW